MTTSVRLLVRTILALTVLASPSPAQVHQVGPVPAPAHSRPEIDIDSLFGGETDPGFEESLSAATSATSEWPSPDALPEEPLACWTTGSSCYPEPRNFMEGQWHESRDGDLDAARHIHLGAALPRIVQGIVRIDLRVLHFHFEGAKFLGIRKVVVRTKQPVPKLMPAPVKATVMGLYNLPITEHLQETYVPLYMDFRQVTTDGWYLMEVDASTGREDGRIVNVRLQTKIYIANNGTVPATIVNHAAVETWLSTTKTLTNTFGYLRVAAANVRRFDSDPSVYPGIAFSGKAEQPHALLAAINSDLHRHPPFYGQIVFDQPVGATLPRKEVLLLPLPAMIAGDRLLVRYSAFEPVEGAAASLIVVHVGSGR